MVGIEYDEQFINCVGADLTFKEHQLTFDLKIKPSKIGGRGVFATRFFSVGETIEICPVLPLTPKEFEAVSNTTLGYYVYTWPGPRQSPDIDPSKYSGSAVVFGYGSMYNHSFEPNAYWVINIKKRTMTFKALKSINAGTLPPADSGSSRITTLAPR